MFPRKPQQEKVISGSAITLVKYLLATASQESGSSVAPSSSCKPSGGTGVAPSACGPDGALPIPEGTTLRGHLLETYIWIFGSTLL